MTQPPQSPDAAPAGWYADPSVQYSARPEAPAQRYWDGTRWTEHVAPAAAPAYAPGYAPYAPGHGTGRATTTPDGVPLAGWWQRVGSQLIDAVLVLIVVAVVGFPFIGQIIGVYGDFFRESIDAAEAGRPAPSQTSIYGDVLVPQLALSAISLVVQVTYYGLMLRFKGGTLGKLALGLRVRLRDTPGQLPWPVVGKRLLGQFGYGLVALVPLVGSIGSLYALLDVLWPLWDPRKQAVHDKIAGTNVVRTR